MRRAFTLVEVLVAISIVMVLAGISVAAVHQARASAKAASCLSNMSQLAKASALYSSDHDDVVVLVAPGTDYTEPVDDDQVIWHDLLRPYLGAYVRCPEAEYRDRPARIASGYAVNFRFVWARRPGVYPPRVLGPIRRGEAPYPSTTVEFLDAPAGMFSMGSPIDFVQQFKSLRPTFPWRAYKTETQHLGGANYSMLDGSARRLRTAQFSSLQDGTRPTTLIWPP